MNEAGFRGLSWVKCAGPLEWQEFLCCTLEDVAGFVNGLGWNRARTPHALVDDRFACAHMRQH
jgi:hypothetical protein